jgi:hypothetical protein
MIDCAANLATQETQTVEQLQRLLFLVTPVAVSKRPWNQDGWCDPVTGKCWIQSWHSDEIDPLASTWHLQLPISAEEIEKGRVCTYNCVYPKGRVVKFTIFYGKSLPYNTPFPWRPQLTDGGKNP